MALKRLDKFIWEIPKEGEMLVSARIYASEEMIQELIREESTDWSTLRQLRNVACLPGIQKHALALADCHPGYGAPIGGVAAMDLEEGVITFGSIGFDINCLEGDAKVLDEFGAYREIKHEKFWLRRKVLCLWEKDIEAASVAGFLRRTEKKVCKIITETGREIIASFDHPFLTKKGMIEAKNLKNGDSLAVFPFEGVPYEKPKNKTIVDENKIKEVLKKHGYKDKVKMKQVVEELKKRGLLPLKLNNEKVPFLIKLIGYSFGDGHVSLTKEYANVSFYGKAGDLQNILDDFKKIGYSTTIYSRKRKHRINTSYREVSFTYTEHSINCGAHSLAALFIAMGAPERNKAKGDFEIPQWLVEAPLWYKRLFLAAFFGAELSSPKTVTKHGYNFYGPVLSINKKENVVKSGKKFLMQIKKLLSEFGIKSRLIKERIEYKNKAGEVSIRLRLQISSESKNLIRLYKKVGFEYNTEKRFLGNVTIQYLTLKEKILKLRKKIEKEVKELRNKGISSREIKKVLCQKYINSRFIERCIWGGRKTAPRISFVFPKFREFIKTYTTGLGKSGVVWEKITRIETISFRGKVYDFTLGHEAHNFIANGFVVSNCGVRTLKMPLKRQDIEAVKEKLAEALFREIPAGLGSEGELRLNPSEIDEVLVGGAEYVINRGYGFKEDLEYTELNGKAPNADPHNVSQKAKQRQYRQVGTLGSGNHYLEVQYVEEIFDENAAKAFGISEGQILVSIHCGSRALGHQIGMDYIQELRRATQKYGIKLRDKELVCAPIQSEEGQRYLSAVNAGMNCAFANRQVLAHLTRKVFAKVLGLDEKEVKTLYDVGHNTAKIERHEINGESREVLVHRKGSTRGFGPGREEIPAEYRKVGQPILVGGTMGTASYILAGTEKGMQECFGSGVHGAGRKMSRHAAIKRFRGERIAAELKQKGIIIKAHSWRGAAEEAPQAYKDIDIVVNVMDASGINKKVARLRPIITIKG